MKLQELANVTGLTGRQIRFMIAEGFLSGPRGGRAHADYGDDHVTEIRRYARLRELGFPPSAIRLLLDAREGIPFPLADGVTLVIAPDRLGSGDATKALVKKAKEVLQQALASSEMPKRRQG